MIVIQINDQRTLQRTDHMNKGFKQEKRDPNIIAETIKDKAQRALNGTKETSTTLESTKQRSRRDLMPERHENMIL